MIIVSEYLKNCIINSSCELSSPPPKPVCQGSLKVSNNNHCSKLFENYWSSIVVNANLCNSLTSNITIEFNPCLTSISFRVNTIKNLYSLRITNNVMLTSISVADGSGWDSQTKTGVGYYVERITIASTLNLN